LNAPVALIAQVLGLNAVWPWKSSAETNARGVVKNCLPSPKNSRRLGSAVLTPLPTGSRRNSFGPLSSTPVRTRNTEFPITGLSPFRTFWL
jgi:hypothetical protein